MNHRLGLAGLTLAAALLVTGCRSQSEGETPAGDGTSPPTAAEPNGQFDKAPDWYVDRRTLAACGVDAEYTDGYPNTEARTCLRRAFEEGAPSEMRRVSYGDEGESTKAHFRVLGAGSYEIVGEQMSADSVVEGWVRYRCDRFVFIDEPGSEVDGVPWINGEGECEQVDWVPS